MKTFIRLIRRYVLTAIAVVLLFLFLGTGMIVWISCKLCLNGMPVPLLRNGYSIFNGTKYR